MDLAETLAASTLLGLALAGVIAFVGAPLLRRGSRIPLAAGDVGPSERELQRTLRALRDIERDRELGLIAAEDIGPLRTRHEARALTLYAEIDDALDARRAELSQAVEIERRALLADVPAGAVAVPAAAPHHRGVKPPAAVGSRRLALASGLAAALFLGGVGAIWYSATSRGPARPIATVRAPDYHALAFDPIAPSRVYLGTHAGLFVSPDRGATWRPIPTAEGDAMAIVAVPGALVAAGHDVFMLSADGGVTWQARPAGLPGTDVHALAASPSDPARLYAAVVDHGVFRSDDAGRSWVRSGQMPASIAGMVVVPDAAGDLLFAATAQEGVLASRDGGRSWANASGVVNGALPTRRVTSIVYDGRSGDTSGGQSAFRGALFIATDRGVFRSTDGGSAWVRTGLEGDIAAIALATDDPAIVVAIDQTGRVYRSADRGVTW